MKASKIVYRPLGMTVGALSCVIAGAAFKQAWKIIEAEGDAPDATDEDQPSKRILLAAAIQGGSSPW